LSGPIQKLTKEEEVRIVKAASRDKLRLTDLIIRFGRAGETIRKILKRYGVYIPKGKNERSF
jgi:uncharacterized FAD-dependent dehydrogenase